MTVTIILGQPTKADVDKLVHEDFQFDRVIQWKGRDRSPRIDDKRIAKVVLYDEKAYEDLAWFLLFEVMVEDFSHLDIIDLRPAHSLGRIKPLFDIFFDTDQRKALVDTIQMPADMEDTMKQRKVLESKLAWAFAR